MRSILFCLFLFSVSVNAYADKVRVYKRASDGKVITSTVLGSDNFPRSEDDDFKLLYGSLEPYQVKIVGSIPDNTKSVNISNDSVVFTPYSQDEIDNVPSNIKKKRIQEGKDELKSAASVNDLRRAVEKVLGD